MLDLLRFGWKTNVILLFGRCELCRNRVDQTEILVLLFECTRFWSRIAMMRADI